MYAGEQLIKVSDFGFDEHYQNREPEVNWYSVESGADASFANDQYALGVIFYQMLAGDLPAKKATEGFTRFQFKAIPKQLRPILEKMLQKDPQDRYSNLASVLKELSACVPSATRVEPAEMPDVIEENRSMGLGRVLGLSALLAFLGVQAYGLFTGKLQQWIATLLESLP